MEVTFNKKSLLVRGPVRIVTRPDGVEIHEVQEAAGAEQMPLAGAGGVKRGRKPGSKNAAPANGAATSFPHGANAQAEQAAEQ